MSNLASIASVLGSPVKHAPQPQLQQQQTGSPVKIAHAHAIPTSVVQAARKLGLSRPGSPSSGWTSSQPIRGANGNASAGANAHGVGSPSRVPVPAAQAPDAPEATQAGPASADAPASATAAPRVRSPLMSDKISYFQSQSQMDLAQSAAPARPLSPPTRMSSRLAALSSPSTSPKIGGIASAFGGTRQMVQPMAMSPRMGARPAATVAAKSGVESMPKSPRMQGANASTRPDTARSQAGREDGPMQEQQPAETASKSSEHVQVYTSATSPAAQSQPQPHKRPALSPVQSPSTIPVATARANPISPPPAKSPLRKQTKGNAPASSVEAGTKLPEGQTQEASPRAVKVLDFAQADVPPSPDIHANGSTSPSRGSGAATAAAAAAVEVPRATAVVSGTHDTVVPLKSSTQSHQPSLLGHSARQPSVEVPPSPIFSSFLSNPNRTSALSFAGLPGRASTQHQGIASNGSMAGQPHAHSREKSIGLGLGLGLGLGKSLSAANAARAGREQQQQQQPDPDSQGSTSNERQSFYSAAGSLSGKKRLSSVLADQPESQSSAASGLSGTSKAAKLDAHTTASAVARASISYTTSSSAPPSKEDATKAKLDMLRNRISSFKGTNATNRVSSVSSTTQLYSARLSTAPHVLEKATIAGASPAFPAAVAPPSAPAATNASAQPVVEVGAGTSAIEPDSAVPASSAQSTLSSAISAFVPAPSFSASFASLFGASLSKPLQPPLSPVHREQKRDDVVTPAHPKSQSQLQSASIATAQAPIYPALPSMTNLAMYLSPPKDQRKVAREPDDDEMEELIKPMAAANAVESTGTVPTASRTPATSAHSRRSSTSSVQSIVDAFEAKATEALHARERERSTSPVQQKRASVGKEASAAPAWTEKAAKRSTTPPFSPPIASRLSTASVLSVMSTRNRVSLVPTNNDAAGNLGELDVADPDVEPIANVRESSPPLPTEDDEDELSMDDAQSKDRATDELAVASQTLPAVQIQKSSMPLGAAKAGAAPATTSVRPAAGVGASFKPSRPNVDAVDSGKLASRPPSQQAQHRPPSRAPSVSSLAPSRASTISAASISKKTGLMSSVNGKGELKSLQLAAAAAKKVSPRSQSANVNSF